MVESSWVTHPWVEASEGRPRFAFHGGHDLDWPQFVDLVQYSESLGFDAYWMLDHPSRNPGCWTTLAALAAVTRTIRLGTLVNCVLYRSTFEVARHATDVDRISNGRVILGLGAGDSEQEFQQLGIDMPPARERVRLLGEMVQSLKGIWGQTPDKGSGIGQTLSPGPVLTTSLRPRARESSAARRCRRGDCRAGDTRCAVPGVSGCEYRDGNKNTFGSHD
jgi:alkanesulfonate monooxygenase SsuD/methylene tetrahydromethanopterin reductase-like flavin-dependent oxidoreductase (luciferase family)